MRLARAVATAALCFALGCEDPSGRPEAAPPGARGAQTRALHVERAADRYDVIANEARLGEVLDALANDAALSIDAEAAPPGWREQRITLSLDGVTIDQALHAALFELPHHLHYEWETGAEPGGPPWPEAPVRLNRVTLGPLYRQPPWRNPDAKKAADARPPRTEPNLARGDGLEDRDPDVRARAVTVLEPAGTGLDTLAETLQNDPSPAVRRSAARALAGGRGLHTFPILLDGLDDPDPEVVVTVIESLEDAWDDHPVPEIRERVAESSQHRDARIRAAAQDFLDWVQE